MPERSVPRYLFAPWDAPPEQLARTFIGRKGLLLDMLSRIISVGEGATPKHSLLVGQRGIGKTHLLCLIHHYVSGHLNLPKEISGSCKGWVSVLLVEEEYSASNTLANFVLYLLKKLSEIDPQEEVWKLPENIIDQSDKAIQDCCFERIEEFSKKHNQKILILIDNLQKIFEQFAIEDQLGLRAFLTRQSAVLLICTAQGVFKQVIDHKAPFFEYFEIDFIPDLSADEMLLMLETRFREDDRESEFERQKAKLTRKIPGIRKLTGGNPRLLLYLYDILLQSATIFDIELALRDTIDKVTEYFRGRLDSLPGQSRKVLDTIAQMDGPATPTEISRASRLSVQTVNAQIRRLKHWGYVQPSKLERKRSTRYDITDRLFRIWRQTATVAGRRRFKFLTEFLKVYYTPEELKEMFYAHKDLLIAEKVIPLEEYARHIEDLYYIQAAAIGELRYEIFDTRLEAITRLGDYTRAEKELEHFRVESARIGDLTGVATAYEKQTRIHVVKEEYDAALKDINELLKMEHYPEALTAVEELLGKSPQEAEAWADRGVAIGNLGDYEKALESFQKASELKPEEAGYWRLQAAALRNLNRYKEALSSAEKAVELKPDDDDAWYERGAAAGNLGDHEKALESFQKASELKPEEAGYWRLQAAALRNLNRYKEALSSAEKAVELKPDGDHAWYERGAAAGNLGDYEKALESFQKASELKPEEAEYWRLQAAALRNLNRYKEALSSAEKAVELKPDGDHAWYGRGLAAGYLGDHEKALESFQKASELKPEEARYWRLQAMVLRQLARSSEALTCINKAIDFDLQNDSNFIQKAWILSELGRIDDALLALDEAKGRKANERDVFHAQGDISLIGGRFGEAKEALENGLKIVPDDWDMLIDFEIARACLGEHGAGMGSLPEAILGQKFPAHMPQSIFRFILDISSACLNRKDRERGVSLLAAGLSIANWQKEDWFGRELGLFLRKLLDKRAAFHAAVNKVKEKVVEKDVLDLLNPYIQASDYVRTGDVSILERLFPEVRELVLEIADKLNPQTRK